MSPNLSLILHLHQRPLRKATTGGPLQLGYDFQFHTDTHNALLDMRVPICAENHETCVYL